MYSRKLYIDFLIYLWKPETNNRVINIKRSKKKNFEKNIYYFWKPETNNRVISIKRNKKKKLEKIYIISENQKQTIE